MTANLWISFKMKGSLISDVHNTELIVMVKTSFQLASPHMEDFSLHEGASLAQCK